MSPDKMQKIKLKFSGLPPEKQNKDYFVLHYDEFNLSCRKAAKWFYINHLQENKC